ISHLRHLRLRVRLWFSLGVALSLVYSVVQAFRTGLSSIDFDVVTLVVFPCALALAWLAWTTEYERVFLPLSRLLVPLKGALVAFFIVPLTGHGHDEELALLAVYVIAAFFFSGLMFRSALVAAFAPIASFALTGIALHLVTPVFWNSLLVLGVT